MRLGNSARRLGPQLDTRGDGGYVVAPPSIHPNGHAYRWAPRRSPNDSAIASLPDVIGRALQPAEIVQPRTDRAVIAPAPRGDRAAVAMFLAWFRTVDCGLTEGQGRNQTAYRIACRALKALPLSDVREIVSAWNSANHPPLDASELTACINSAAGIRSTQAAA